MTKDHSEKQKDAVGEEKTAGGLQGRTQDGSDPGLVWPVEQIYWHKRHVCRIDIEKNEGTIANGTGFLVGPNLVLTNNHVVKNVSPSHIKCRFDYMNKGATGIEFGNTVSVKSNLKTRRPSDSEIGRQYDISSTIHPGKYELDYALLKLSQRIGWRPYRSRDGLGIRGWIGLTSHKPDAHPQSRVFILQHPMANPISHADGTRSEKQPAETRLRYRTTTEPGSSGSPCFQYLANGSDKPALVALHNYGEPGFGDGNDPEFNHGIPIELIARDIKDAGLEYPKPPPNPKPIAIFAAVACGLFALVFFIPSPPPPDECIASLQSAYQQYNSKHYAVSRDQFEGTVELCRGTKREEARAFSGKAASLARLGNYADAVKAYKQAFEVAQNHSQKDIQAKAKRGSGYSYEALKKYGDAAAEYARGLENVTLGSALHEYITMDYGRALTKNWLNNGAALESPDRDKAIKHFNIFLTNYSQTPRPWTNYYLACLNSRDQTVVGEKKAIDQLRNSSASLPKDGSQHSRSEREHFRKILSAQEQLPDSHPDAAPVCPPLARLLSDEKYRSVLNQIIHLVPN